MDLNCKRLIGIAVAFVVVLNLVVFVGYKALVRKVTSNVISQLQKEYSPSPYGPGLDQDKLNPRRTLYEELIHRQQQGQPVEQEQPMADVPRPEIVSCPQAAAIDMSISGAWRSEWEKERGAE
jgi:hypothetical protein